MNIPMVLVQHIYFPANFMYAIWSMEISNMGIIFLIFIYLFFNNENGATTQNAILRYDGNACW